MDGEIYLSSGYGIRAAIEARRDNWVRFGKMARAWAPPRIKTILVSPEHGTPYLNTSQVFNYRAEPRKWLALNKIFKGDSRLANQGTILLMASASVGRTTLVTKAHEGCVLSHHFMRVEPIDTDQHGWIYAYLRSPQARAMMSGSQYASIIRHIEPHHVGALPIPRVDLATAADFSRRVSRILDLRNEGHRLSLEAEARFEKCLGALKINDWGENGYSIRASKTLLSGRRRFDASVHNPGVAAIRRHLAKHGEGLTTIAEAGYDVWLPTRFRRVSAEDGVPLVESAALLEVNPDIDKRIAEVDFGDAYRGRVQPGWLLVARSGQVYGIIGTAVLATEALANQVISDDVIRVAPTSDCRVPAGYLLVALTHPILGRPLVKSLAYGSSIPHIDPSDFIEHKIVRLNTTEESTIANLAEASAQSRAKADVLEREIAQDAGKIIDRFIAG